MVDPLTIVGGIAAVIQIAEALTSLTLELRSCIRTVRYAPQEVRQLRLDLSNFSGSLHMFYEQSNTWLEDMEESPEKDVKKEHIAGLIKECRAVKRGFEELLRRFFVSPSQIMNVYDRLDRIRWYFRKRIVAGLKLLLESAKSSVTLFIVLHMCGDLQRKVEKLQRALQKVPKGLKHQLRLIKRQLKEQMKVTQDTHKCLIEHIRNTPYSHTPLIPDVRPIIGETRAMEQYAVRTIRRETRRVQPRLSKTEQSRSSRSQDPSLDMQLTLQRPRSPQPSILAPNDLPDLHVGTTSPAAVAHTNSRAASQSANSEPISLLSNQEDPRGAQQVTISSTPSLGPEASSVLSQPSQAMEPTIVGPIIRDDGKEIKEMYGPWRVGAGEASPLGIFSDSPERNDSLSTTEEPSESDQKTPKAEPGPYRAVPPFMDDDWKGIRRRPST